MKAPKRIVVWGTGFVGKMVIPEILAHPDFELVGVGVSNPDKVGRDVGEICGIGSIGLVANDEVDTLIDLGSDALVHYGPTAAHATENMRDISAFLRAGIDVCSTVMTPWVWPSMSLNPPSWIDPISEACRVGGASCFTTGIDPGFANDLFPMTLMGLCGEVRQVRALEILDYINYEGDYEDEMGIGRPPEFTPLLEHTDILVMSWGATVPMMAHAVGIELDEITTTWEKWGTDAAPDWPRGNQDDVYRVVIEGSPSITQETAFRFSDGSGRDAAAAGCLATGLRALNAVPAVNGLPPGWVTALDLPLIPGIGTIR